MTIDHKAAKKWAEMIKDDLGGDANVSRCYLDLDAQLSQERQRDESELQILLLQDLVKAKERRCSEIEAATVERCAKVCDDMVRSEWFGDRWEYGRRIRALAPKAAQEKQP